MNNYSNLPQHFKYRIEHVDYDIELMGLTLDKLAYSSVIFLVSMRLFGPAVSIFVIAFYIISMRKMYKMELEGRPITFNPRFQRFLRRFPAFIKNRFFSELTYIEMAEDLYRT